MKVSSRRHGGGLEWSCEKCDSGHNGYIATQTWWRERPPKICWRCVRKSILAQKSFTDACWVLGQAVEAAGIKSIEELRDAVWCHTVSWGHASRDRLVAATWRSVKIGFPSRVFG